MSVTATPAAHAALLRLRIAHGPLMLVLSDGNWPSEDGNQVLPAMWRNYLPAARR
jgi:hypothetical protein